MSSARPTLPDSATVFGDMDGRRGRWLFMMCDLVVSLDAPARSAGLKRCGERPLALGETSNASVEVTRVARRGQGREQETEGAGEGARQAARRAPPRGGRPRG